MAIWCFPRIRTGLASEVWPWVGFRLCFLRENPGTSYAKHEVRYYFLILFLPIIFNTSIFVLFLHQWWGAAFKRFVFLSLRSYKSRWVIFVIAASCCAATKVVPWQRTAKEIVLYHKSFNSLYLFPGLSVFLMTARVFSTVRLLDDCSFLVVEYIRNACCSHSICFVADRRLMKLSRR